MWNMFVSILVNFQVQNAFDAINCHFMSINSRKITDHEPGDDDATNSSNMTTPWLNFSHRFSTVELRRVDNTGSSHFPALAGSHNSVPSHENHKVASLMAVLKTYQIRGIYSGQPEKFPPPPSKILPSFIFSSFPFLFSLSTPSNSSLFFK